MARTTHRRLLPKRIHDADVRAFRHVARSRTPVLDATMPPLTHASNHSLLWMAIAAVLAAIGGRFGRRGALRGLLALGATSFVTNIPAKLILRRTRPPIDDVPRHRRTRRKPLTTSFPSGHAASAFAFATGVAIERPVIGVPLLGLAGAVAYSRVHVGVHYPSDVVTGAAVGATIAIATRHFWPPADDAPATAARARVDVERRVSPDGTGLVIVANPSSGPTSTNLDALREAFPGAEIVEEDGDIETTISHVAHSAHAIGVCGGDGTVNLAASAAVEHGKPLVVIPGGTLNHFARDAGIASLDDASSAVADGSAIAVDVGVMAGRTFVNTASFGAYADFVDLRDRVAPRIGKWPAATVAFVRALRRSTPIDLDIDGRRTTVWMSFIGNCVYRPDGAMPAERTQLDDGYLDVRLFEARGRLPRMRLVWALLTGTVHRSRAFTRSCALGPVTVRSHDGPLRLAVDGETFDGPAEFTIEKKPSALTVFAPTSAAASDPRDGGSTRRTPRSRRRRRLRAR